MAGEEWILHAASQDLACLREVGLDPERIFDTELGARLAGLPRVGLGAVVEELLGIHLAKEHSAADWSTRPLPQPGWSTPRSTSSCCPTSATRSPSILDEAGKTEIARQEFEAVLARETVCAVEPWRRLSGLHGAASARATSRSPAPCGRPATTTPARSTPRPGRLIPDLSLVAAARVAAGDQTRPRRA